MAVARYDVPDRMYARVKGLSQVRAYGAAQTAVEVARRLAPKGFRAVAGAGGSASRFEPYAGNGYFGVRWVDQYVWFQEHGAQPFLMKNLAGKTIPMWIKDPTGSERRDNPKAKTRITESGITEVLIFRKASTKGTRKTIMLPSGKTKSVPASYPGAPGRIARREARHPHTAPGKAAGAIAQKNIGVRWYNPGLEGRHFMQKAIIDAGMRHGLLIATVVARHPSGQEEILV
jgi:hypothetical protein